MFNTFETLLFSTLTVVAMAQPNPAPSSYQGPCEPGDICTKVILNVPQEYIVFMEDSVPDFEEWVYRAIDGKVNKCKERIIKKEIEQSLSEGSEVPDTPYTILNKALNRPDYKNRRERDEEAKVNLDTGTARNQ